MRPFLTGLCLAVAVSASAFVQTTPLAAAPPLTAASVPPGFRP